MTDTATTSVQVFSKNVTISKQVVVLQAEEILAPQLILSTVLQILSGSEGYHTSESTKQK